MNYWLFQATLKRYDLTKAIKKGREVFWYGRFLDMSEMRIGDVALLWQAGRNAGIYGVARLVGKPQFWGTTARVKIVYTKRLDSPIGKDVVKTDPVLRDLSVLHLYRLGTGFPVSKKQWTAFRKLNPDVKDTSRASRSHSSTKGSAQPVNLHHPLSQQAQRLLDLIVQGIRDGQFVPEQPQTYLGYRQAHVLLSLSQKGQTWGRSLQRQGLNELAKWVQKTNVPAITGLIVDTGEHKPASGYFKMFNNGVDDDKWWADQVVAAIEYDWSPYSKTDEKPPTRKQFQTFFSEGEKRKISGQTRKRCEALVRMAKSYFRSADGVLRCAACKWSRPNAACTGDIVEIHHIRKISSLPQKGVRWTYAEALKLLAPLCPNCHRIVHCNPDGGEYSIEELTEIVKT